MLLLSLNQLTQTLLYVLIKYNKNCCYYLTRHAFCLLIVLMVTKTKRNGIKSSCSSLVLVRLVLYVLGWVVNKGPTPLQSSVPISQCPYLLAPKKWARFYDFITRGARGDFWKFYKNVFSVCPKLLANTCFRNQTRGTQAWT